MHRILIGLHRGAPRSYCSLRSVSLTLQKHNDILRSNPIAYFDDVQRKNFHSSGAVLKRRGGSSALEPKYLWRKKKKSKINKKIGKREKIHGEPGSRPKIGESYKRATPAQPENALEIIENTEIEKMRGRIDDFLAPVITSGPIPTSLEATNPDKILKIARTLSNDINASKVAVAKKYNFAMRCLSAAGRFDEVRLILWKEMIAKEVVDVHAFTALLDCAANAKYSSAIDAAWRDMKSMGIKPTQRTWSALLNALGKCGRVDDAVSAGSAMKQVGIPWGTHDYNVVLSAMVKADRLDEAWKLYREMIELEVDRNICVYTTMMRACAKGREFERAMCMMEEVEVRGIYPSQATFNALLRAASTSSLWMRAYGNMIDRIRDRMRGYNIPPGLETFQSLICCYGNFGDADGVQRTLKEMQQWAVDQPSIRTYKNRIDPEFRIGSPSSIDKSLGGSWEGAFALSIPTYSAILSAYAGCMSVGEKQGTRPRYGCLPEQAEELAKEKAKHRTILISFEDREKLEILRYSSLDFDRDHEESVTGKNRKPGKRVKFRGMTHCADGRTDDMYDEYKSMLAEIVAKSEARERGEPIKQIQSGGTIGSRSPSREIEPGNSSSIEDLIAELRLEQEALLDKAESSGDSDSDSYLSDSDSESYDSDNEQENRYTAHELEELIRMLRAEAKGDYSHMHESIGSEYSEDPRWKEILDRVRRRKQMSVDEILKDEESSNSNIDNDDEDYITVTSSGETYSKKEGDLAMESELKQMGPDVQSIDFNDDLALNQLQMIKAARNRPGGITRTDLASIFGTEISETDKNFEDSSENLSSIFEAQPWEDEFEKILKGEMTLDDTDLNLPDSRNQNLNLNLNDTASIDGDSTELLTDMEIRNTQNETEAGYKVQLEPDRFNSGQASIDRLLSGEDMEIDVESDGFGGWNIVPESDKSNREVIPLEKSLKETNETEIMEYSSDDPFFLNRMGKKSRKRHILAYAREVYETAIAVHGPPNNTILNGMLSVLAEGLHVTKAMDFFQKEFAMYDAKPDRKTTRILVRMMCRARNPEAASKIEHDSRDLWGLRADPECLGMVLNEWAKRDDHETMARTLDIFEKHGVVPSERWLYFTRRNADKASFDHPWLPPNPYAYMKKRNPYARTQQKVKMINNMSSRRGILGTNTNLY